MHLTLPDNAHIHIHLGGTSASPGATHAPAGGDLVGEMLRLQALLALRPAEAKPVRYLPRRPLRGAVAALVLVGGGALFGAFMTAPIGIVDAAPAPGRPSAADLAELSAPTQPALPGDIPEALRRSLAGQPTLVPPPPAPVRPPVTRAAALPPPTSAGATLPPQPASLPPADMQTPPASAPAAANPFGLKP